MHSNHRLRFLRVLSAVGGLVALFAAAPASARPEFPPIIRDHLDMACTPECTICHRSIPNPDVTPFTQPFPNSLVARGGWDYEEATLVAALDQLNAVDEDGDGISDVDSDQDGVPDIVELKSSNVDNPPTDGTPVFRARDPSAAGIGNACQTSEAPEVLYGCGAARIAPPLMPGVGPWAVGVTLGLFAAIALRRTWRGAP